MGIQEIILVAIFAFALFYIGRVVYRSLKADNGCASNCGKCSADFSNVKDKPTNFT